jgi:stage III sporulation protein AA
MEDYLIKPFETALYGMPQQLKNFLLSVDEPLKRTAEEIRLRANQQIYLTVRGQSVPLGRRTQPDEVAAAFLGYCRHSVYSHADEIREGYINLENGHRAGFGGRAVCEDGKIKTFRDITSLNIRISREIRGAADEFLSGYSGGGALIFGKPGCGKTTILRDAARQINKRVVIIDTRGEIANGDVGATCDILSAVPKADGIQMAVRLLYPQVIIFDEIGTLEEVRAVAEGLNSGVPVITTAHADSLEQLRSRPVTSELLKTGAVQELFKCENYRCVKI